MKFLMVIGIIFLVIGIPGLLMGDPSHPEELFQIIFYCGGGIAAILWSIRMRNRKWEDEFKKRVEEEERIKKAYDKTEEFNFFEGCLNANDVKKRYKKLMQIYHPDSNWGNEEYSKTINRQYKSMMEKYNS